MKNSFRDPLTNVLKGWGYADSNNDDLTQEEPEDFSLEPGKWKLEGGQWVAYVPTIVPQSVTPLQARKALKQQDLLATVQAAVGAAGEDTQMAWEYATSFDRQSPFVLDMASALGWAESELDGLFVLAATL